MTARPQPREIHSPTQGRCPLSRGTVRAGPLVLLLHLVLGLGLGGTGFAPATRAAVAANPRPFRLAFSANMFTEINENDVRAAMKVWIMTVAHDRNVPVDPEALICRTPQELEQIGRDPDVDGLGLLTTEYDQLRHSIEFGRLAQAITGGEVSEEYLLLVHRESGLERIEQLNGRTLSVLRNPRMSLAVIWLDTVLLEAGLPETTNTFQHVAYSTKTTGTALPVFFRQTAACLITRNGFRVMCELNPQLNRQLRPILTSPPLVPSGFAFRARPDTALLERVLQEMVHLGENPAGRQILALTKADRIEERPTSCLDSSLELIARRQQLRQQKAVTAAPPTAPVASTGPGAN